MEDTNPITQDTNPITQDTNPIKFKLNYSFQPQDKRDYKYIASVAVDPSANLPLKSIISKKMVLPASFSLQSKLSPILDQGPIGSCVSNAFALIVSTQTKSLVNPSRLFNYALSRVLTNVPLNEDSGLYLRDACVTLSKYGTCQELIWPYNTRNYSVLPPLTVFKSTNLFKSFTYYFLNQDITSIKQCLTTYGVPIAFGVMIYSSFFTQAVSTTGIVNSPDTVRDTLEGGHCMCIVGYDDITSRFLVANSWGTSWGNKGFCTIPYAYLMNPNLAGDFCYTQIKL